MISDFLETFPEARESLERADEILKVPLSKIMREGPPVPSGVDGADARRNW
jgi:hypothetical protein